MPESGMNYPERIVPGEAEPGIDAIHLKRYDFAAPLCGQRRVLDAGCGVGYGTTRLAAAAASAVGVDIDANAISYAREHYGAPNLSFEVMDVGALAFADASFDAVCSFETIEHVDNADRVLAEFVRVLAKDGVLVVSTPQVEETTTSPANPFHRVEFSRTDFEALLRRHFPSVELYGQRRLQTRRHRIAQRLDMLGLRRRFPALRRASAVLGTTPTAELTADDIVITREGLEQATEIVAVCR
jgi:SAM-dependent methyltransferase